MRTFFSVIIYTAFLTLPISVVGANGSNAILGKWISVKKNVIIEVYKTSDTFQAKVLWFNDLDDSSRPMRTRKDIKNPNKSLRNQLIIGMDVLENLTYNIVKHRWEQGVIYDASSGRHWSSVVYFNKKNQLEVKGYWKFEFLCQTMEFTRL